MENILREIVNKGNGDSKADVVVYGVRIPGEEGRAGMATIFSERRAAAIPRSTWPSIRFLSQIRMVRWTFLGT